MPRTAHRELAGARGGLARRAHADRRPREPARRDTLSGLRLSLRVRQDQSRHADPSGLAPGLARVHRGRRHRVAPPRRGRTAVGHQPGGRLFRGGAGHQSRHQPQRLRDDPPRHALHQRRAHRRQPALVGGPGDGPARDRLAGTALRPGQGARGAPQLALHGVGPAQSRLLAARRGSRRGADHGAGVRRPPPRGRATRLRSARLAPRRPGRRLARLRDHRRGGRSGRRHAARPDGDAAVLRLQLRDYWRHWLDIGARLARPPRIYHVNWFRRDAQGKLLWPGYGENLRVLAWMLDRCAGRTGATEAAIGWLPRTADLELRGLDVSADRLAGLLTVDAALWRKEVADMREYLGRYGSRLPAALLAELDSIERRLPKAHAAPSG